MSVLAGVMFFTGAALFIVSTIQLTSERAICPEHCEVLEHIIVGPESTASLLLSLLKHLTRGHLSTESLLL